MAVEIVMPRLGWTMETGIIAEWLKHDGESVQAGDALFTVETDKVAQEVEAMDSGILRLPPDSAPIGAVVAVGTVLAYLVRPGEAAPFEQYQPQALTQPVDVASPVLPSTHVAAPIDVVLPSENGRAAVASPRARRVAGELGLDWTAIVGSGRAGRIVERDVRATAVAQPVPARARVTPVARRVAQQSGVDVAELATKMPGKRITRLDIEALSRSTSNDAASSGLAHPFNNVRRVIAERMAHSAHTVAPVTLTTEVDATELVALRERIKQAVRGSEKSAPSYTDLLTRLVALVLLEHPWLNSSLQGEAIVQHEAVHIGIAVDTDQGLLVPVVRDAHLKSIQQIALESAQLIERARVGASSLDDLQGGTFTITNLGLYDIDTFTPIINLPECAILGVGRIVARPVVIDEHSAQIAVRKMLALSLTFDHRMVDGGPAARFLQQVKRWVEDPYIWLTA